MKYEELINLLPDFEPLYSGLRDYIKQCQVNGMTYINTNHIKKHKEPIYVMVYNELKDLTEECVLMGIRVKNDRIEINTCLMFEAKNKLPNDFYTKEENWYEIVELGINYESTIINITTRIIDYIKTK